MSTERPRIGVIIPAHNEEAVIRRCLDALLADAQEHEFDVVVVANGCTDRTAEIAASYGPPVRVLSTPVGCKATALNDGEAVLRPDRFPRIYLDGDLELSTDAARQISRAVEDPGTLAAAPNFDFDTSSSSWAVRAFYRVWQAMPYLNSGRIAGAYALSRTGRARFTSFPKVIADDGFVRLHFALHERSTLESCSVVVAAPRTLKDLIKIKTRSRIGTIQLRQRFPHLFENEAASETASLRQMFQNPSLAPLYIVYLAVNLVARVRARIQLRRGTPVWERDESSRVYASDEAI